MIVVTSRSAQLYRANCRGSTPLTPSVKELLQRLRFLLVLYLYYLSDFNIICQNFSRYFLIGGYQLKWMTIQTTIRRRIQRPKSYTALGAKLLECKKNFVSLSASGLPRPTPWKFSLKKIFSRSRAIASTRRTFPDVANYHRFATWGHAPRVL
jgi:hypothetical protein